MGTPFEPGWVLSVLKHIGFKGDFDRIIEVEGWRGMVWCKHEKYQSDTLRDRWEIDMPRSPKLVAKDLGAVRSLNTLFGGLFKGSDLGKAKETQTVTRAGVGEVPAE